MSGGSIMNGGLRGNRLLLMAAAVLLFVLAGRPALAQAPIPGYPTDTYAGDPREVALIPRYCIYTQVFRNVVPGGNDPAAMASWYAYMGEIFHHMHHYCAGLMKMNRALFLAKDSATRRFYFADAITEIDYVMNHIKDDFVLVPEMLTKKGECQVRLDQGPLGIYSFERAIEAKKDYWPAYAQISDYYKTQGDTKKARAALEAGLAQSPDASGLTRRLAELSAPSSSRTQR
jgi:tetratricopeptide (TPR) repeat protein